MLSVEVTSAKMSSRSECLPNFEDHREVELIIFLMMAYADGNKASQHLARQVPQEE